MKDFNVKVNFLTTGTGQASGGARQVAASMQEVQATASSMMRTLAGMAAQLAAPLSLGAMVKTGIEFNRVMEDTKIGIAGVLGVYRSYVDEQGRALVGQDSFNAAQQEAADLQKDLAMAALATTASYTDMVEAFQVGVGPMVQGGVALKDTVALTQRLTQAMGALGIPMHQLGIEMRQFLRGDEMRSALMQRLGVTKAMIEEWKRSGTLFQEVMNRTKSIGMAADAATRTFSGGLSNLKDAFQQFMGKAFEGLYEKAKQTLFDIQRIFVEIVPQKGGGFVAQFNEDLLEVVVVVGEAMVTLVDIVKTAASSIFGSLTAAVQSSGGSWKEFFQVVALGVTALVEVIATGFRTIAFAFAHPLKLAETAFTAFGAAIMNGIASLIERIAKLLGDMAPKWLKQMAASARETATAGLLGIEKTANEVIGASGGLMKGTKALFDQFAFGAGKTEDLRKKFDALLNKLRGVGDESDETAKRFANLMKASDAYAKSLDQMRRKAEGGLPDLFKTIGWDDAAEGLRIQQTFEKLSETMGEWAFVTGQRMDEAYAALEEWRTKAQEALASPFKKALPLAKTYTDQIGQMVKRTASQIRADAEEMSRKLIDAGDGVRAAWVMAFASVATEAESMYRQTMDTWNAMGQAFDDGFYALFSGKVDSLTDVWKSFVDSMVRSFSQSVTDMVQRGLAGLGALAGKGGDIRALPGTTEYNWQTGTWEAIKNPEQYGQGASALGGLGTAVGAGGASYGLYSSLGGKNNAIGAFSAVAGGVSALALASLGSMAGPIGAIIGAIVGLLLQALVGAKETAVRIGERVLPGGGGNYGASVQEWGFGGNYDYMGYGGGPRINKGEIPFGPKYPGEEWDPDKPIRQIPMAFKTQLRETAESFLSDFADIFEVADPSTRALFTQALNDKMTAYMNSFDVKIHAGSEEDFKYNLEKFFSSFLPNQFLAAGFGRTMALPETAGITEFLDHGEEPVKGAAAKLWDPTAPIPMMLSGLGVTAERIAEIASMVGAEDPKILIQYIRDLVGILSEMRSLRTEMAMTREELFAEMDAEAARSPADLFRQNSADLVARLNELSLYTGDEQIKQTQEVLAALRERWEAEKKYIAEIRGMLEALTAGIATQKMAMADFFLTEAEQLERLRKKVFSITDWGPTVAYDWQARIAEATTPEEVQRIAQEMQSAIGQLFQALAAQVNAAKALISDIDALYAGNWGGASERDRSTVDAYEQDFEDLQTKMARASTLSGMEQVQAIKDVQAAAQEMYQRQLQLIATIDSNIAALHKSIEQQKWDLVYQDLNPQEQADALAERIRMLRDQLQNASSPEQVQALTSEIQQLIGQYMGLFAADDPRRAEAKSWAMDLLDDIEEIATAAYQAMRDRILSTNEEIKAALLAAKDILAANITDASAEIERLKALLDLLNDAVETKLNGMIDEIIDTNAAILAALEAASHLFTDSSLAASRALAGDTGDGGLTRSARETAEAQVRLRDSSDGLKAAFDRLAGRIDGLVPGAAADGTLRSAPASAGFYETLRRAGPTLLYARATGV